MVVFHRKHVDNLKGCHKKFATIKNKYPDPILSFDNDISTDVRIKVPTRLFSMTYKKMYIE